jgi:hypothetical protein
VKQTLHTCTRRNRLRVTWERAVRRFGLRRAEHVRWSDHAVASAATDRFAYGCASYEGATSMTLNGKPPTPANEGTLSAGAVIVTVLAVTL